MKPFDRRRFLTTMAASGAVIAVPARGQVGDSGGGGGLGGGLGGVSADSVAKSLTPYLTIGDFAEDRGRVFMFFMFECPYCQANWRALTAWGATLPKSFRFVDVPVILDTPDSQAAAYAFYTVKALAPARLSDFKANAYATAQQGRASANDFAKILKDMGFTEGEILRYARGAEMQARLNRSITLATRYSVEVTPSFGIGGQYETNANFTNGDYSLLTRLLSGLVSRQIERASAKT
jgi:thiol:disulfide interchange protein DsbA